MSDPIDSSVDELNPYSAPGAAGVADKPRHQYTLGQMMCATFFGSVILAGIMMAKNWKAAGEATRAYRVFYTCLAIGIAGIIASVMPPGRLPGFIFTIICMISVSRYFTANLQNAFRKCSRDGVKRHSNWRVFGLIIIFTATILGIAFGVGCVLYALGIEIPD